MAVILVSTPNFGGSPAAGFWLATESPNNFRLQRKDWNVVSVAGGGSPTISVLTLDADYTGAIDNVIAFISAHNGLVYTGTVLLIDAGLRDITTSIDYDAAMTTGYFNDNTLHAGYHFEGRLTINSVLNPLTIYSTPDAFGLADLDVSGILRIMTSLGKTGTYPTTIPVVAEITKSGHFTLEGRECWYGSNESWTAEGSDWWYAEVVRSEEQGSNLHDYDPSFGDVPFLNLFDRPVYFLGLPFDLSFILPEGTSSIDVTIRNFSSTGAPGTVHTYTVNTSALEGRVNSLTIDSSMIDSNTSYITAEIV
jgi:hypothetical protein